MIQQEDIIIIKMFFASNSRALKYIMQTLIDLKGEIYCNRIIVGNFNTNSQSIQKIKKEIVELNYKLDLIGLIDIYRIFHPMQRHTCSFHQHMKHSPE